MDTIFKVVDAIDNVVLYEGDSFIDRDKAAYSRLKKGDCRSVFSRDLESTPHIDLITLVPLDY